MKVRVGYDRFRNEYYVIVVIRLNRDGYEILKSCYSIDYIANEIEKLITKLIAICLKS